MKDIYIIGDQNPPDWCREYLMPYIRTNGSTGYELSLEKIVFDLKVGDVLEWDGRRIKVTRCKIH